MKNKYFILVLTFLCVLASQTSFGQDYNDFADNSWEADGDLIGDDLDEVVVVNDYHEPDYSEYINADLYDPYNHIDDPTPVNFEEPTEDPVVNPKNPVTPDPEVCSLAVCTKPGYTVDTKLCACVPPPKLWYLDNDGDDYYSAMLYEGEKPSGNYKDTTKGYDCDDSDAKKNGSNCGLPLWYFDNDGDGYHGDIQDSDTSPGVNWGLTTKGEDCNDDDPQILNNCDGDDPPCKTSKEDLKLLFPNLTDAKAALLADTINKFSKYYGIDSQEKLQHFLAQTGHESNNFKTFGEYTNHQPKNIMSGPFSDYFNAFGKEGKDPQKADLSSIHTDGAKYVDGEKFLNIIYDDRNPNRINKIGNIYDGDGYKFRGRGALQITGRDNYTKFTTFYNSISNSTPKDFTKTPDDLKNNFEISIHASLWFFQKFVLDGIKNFQTKATNADAKAQDKLITKVSNIVNGGGNGLADRKTRLQDAKTKIKCN